MNECHCGVSVPRVVWLPFVCECSSLNVTMECMSSANISKMSLSLNQHMQCKCVEALLNVKLSRLKIANQILVSTLEN